jgi:adenylylsulfate kinase
MADAGILVLTAFVSPYAGDRDYARWRLEDTGFWEIYEKCRVEECTRRDIKGHYQKARQGLIRNFTGISSPYEAPENPQLVIDTESLALNDSVQTVIDFIMHKGILCLPEAGVGYVRTPIKGQRF